MKAFNKIFAVVVVLVIVVFVSANAVMLTEKAESGRPYLVEVSRLVCEIEKDSFEIKDLANCKYVTGVNRYGEDFYNSPSDYVIREINGVLYRFDYVSDHGEHRTKQLLTVNIILGAMTAVLMGVMVYIKIKILAPFERLTDVPYELSKGNLSSPVKETKNRFFGRFIWGVDMLRENIEQQKERELSLQRDKKMLLLSLSHDIKTPLMAIGGYTENIMEGQLSDEEQKEYLSAILKNIEFTDSIINRTLLLNRLDNTSEMKSEKISVEKAVSDAISKYKPMFEEKNIRITTEGSAEVKADRTSFEKIVENLVSNAVKYTPENGTVKITADKKQLIVSNTVKEKIDTKELKTPFVRGDKSRSNTDGCGLGLSIAERAAAVNGFKLNVSCTDAEFKTVIKF